MGDYRKETREFMDKEHPTIHPGREPLWHRLAETFEAGRRAGLEEAEKAAAQVAWDMQGRLDGGTAIGNAVQDVIRALTVSASAPKTCGTTIHLNLDGKQEKHQCMKPAGHSGGCECTAVEHLAGKVNK